MNPNDIINYLKPHLEEIFDDFIVMGRVSGTQNHAIIMKNLGVEPQIENMVIDTANTIIIKRNLQKGMQ